MMPLCPHCFQPVELDISGEPHGSSTELRDSGRSLCDGHIDANVDPNDDPSLATGRWEDVPDVSYDGSDRSYDARDPACDTPGSRGAEPHTMAIGAAFDVLVQDCDVCCNPLRIEIRRDGAGFLSVEVFAES